ncbi:TIM barrel protein [uncultured Roseibium sp.]|uniref:hydroxypyruvate isomerase family protein n=1 Tax=uncultured Roseibium sp. TaxID=1936171 RepID=UPI00260F9A13|nr:TIM barrel protein [uncultured Roseibium sp.]
MTSFSANLGFLWADRALPAAIRAARAHGFDAVECHWPYETPVLDVMAALEETGLEMLGLNTRRGDVSNGDNGLAALPQREEEARAAIDEAIDYADRTDTAAIHVMAGKASGSKAQTTFLRNLDYATTRTDRTILIEPLNRHDAPGYFLNTTMQARDIITELAVPNLKLMFDCYHVARNEGDVLFRLQDLLPIIGHIQVASVPGRRAPDHGELHYPTVFSKIADLGWKKPIGAEYKPSGDTEEGLDWMKRYNS